MGAGPALQPDVQQAEAAASVSGGSAAIYSRLTATGEFFSRLTAELQAAAEASKLEKVGAKPAPTVPTDSLMSLGKKKKPRKPKRRRSKVRRNERKSAISLSAHAAIAAINDKQKRQREEEKLLAKAMRGVLPGPELKGVKAAELNLSLIHI